MLEEREGRKLPPKTTWVTYGLQRLSPERFLEVVEKILDGELVLLKPPDVNSLDVESTSDAPVISNGIESEELENIEECFLTRI
jgi:hypothetical protein